MLMEDYCDSLGILLSKDNAELLRDALDVFLEGGYTYEDAEILVEYGHTELSTYAWNDEYLHVYMRDDYDVLVVLLSKDHAGLLRDTLDVFIGGGFTDE